MTELCHTGRGLSEEFDDDFQNRLAAYFCRDLLPQDLIVEHLEEYERPLKEV